MSQKLVSIIIVNWNGGDVLQRCLESLVKVNYSKWELILVDNGSTDGSYLLSQDFQSPVSSFQLIQNRKNLGFAPANNLGYKKAKGDYILLLNNDTEVSPNFLSLMVEKMESDSKIGVLQPKIFMLDKKGYLDNAGSFITRIGFWYHWGFAEKDSKEFDQEKEIFSAKGACMLIRKNIIDKISLFDSDFVSYFEETDFCWRVWLVGYKVLYFPKAHIFHKVGFTIRRQNVLDINFHYYKNRICSLIKNLELKNVFSILGVHLIISLGIAGAFLLRGNVKNGFMIFQAIWWNLLNLGGTLKKRGRVQRIRLVSDKLLFANLSRPANWSKFFGDFKRVEEDIKRK